MTFETLGRIAARVLAEAGFAEPATASRECEADQRRDRHAERHGTEREQDRAENAESVRVSREHGAVLRL